MRYRIQNIRHSVDKLDDHRINFNYEVHFTEPENMVVNYFYDLALLMPYLRDKHPGFYNYLQQVENTIDCWGPKEHLLMQEIGEVAIAQLYTCLEE